MLTLPRFYEHFSSANTGDKYPSEALADMPIQKKLPMYKWSHYFDIYVMYLGKYRKNRKSPLNVLEIGIADGGSLRFWQDFFGPACRVLGVDIDPKCMKLPVGNCWVRIGNQANRPFLTNAIIDFGGLDIVIDDGSHINAHVISSFKTLFPLMNEGGTYLIEDVCTSYWPGIYRAGLNRPGTTVSFFKSLLDQ